MVVNSIKIPKFPTSYFARFAWNWNELKVFVFKHTKHNGKFEKVSIDSSIAIMKWQKQHTIDTHTHTHTRSGKFFSWEWFSHQHLWHVLRNSFYYTFCVFVSRLKCQRLTIDSKFAEVKIFVDEQIKFKGNLMIQN
jgi:hypothetical protein